MIDYVWWLWENIPDNIIPADWNGQVPRPYTDWSLSDTLNERNFCYTYAPPRNRAQRRKKFSMRKYLQDPASLPTDLSALEPDQQEAIKKILSQPVPQMIPYDSYHFLTKHAENEEQSKEIYKSYGKAVKLSQLFHLGVKMYFKKDALTVNQTAAYQPSVVQSAFYKKFDKKSKDTKKWVCEVVDALVITR